MSDTSRTVRFFLSNLITNILSLLLGVLCLIYLGVLYIFKRDSFTVKDRPIPPKCLQNPEYGEHKYITANGIKLHYVEKGDPSKPLMLFVHGFPEFWYSWRYQMVEFSKDYWCIAIDQRGYGDSDKPEKLSSYTMDNMVADLRALVKALGRDKLVLVCHDWGSLIGWDYVAEHTETLIKYIMIGGPSKGVYKKLSSTSWDQFLKGWYVHLFQIPYLPEIALQLHDFKCFKVLEGKYTTDEDLEAFKYTFSKPNAFTYPINYYRASRKSLTLSGKQSKKISDNCAPGLYLLGEKEVYISKLSGPAMEKAVPNVTYKVIRKATHFAQQDNPDETNALMREFLKK